MEEACCTQNGILNTHQYTWADENTHSVQETRFQQQLAVNAWAGII
jgi:hypothetical protein